MNTQDPATTTQNATPSLSGSPSTPQHGSLNIDLQNMVDQLKGAANYTLTVAVSGATYGSASNYMTVYADAIGTQADHELRLNNVTGYGTLIVKGDLQLAGNINWHGIIIVTGSNDFFRRRLELEKYSRAGFYRKLIAGR